MGQRLFVQKRANQLLILLLRCLTGMPVFVIVCTFKNAAVSTGFKRLPAMQKGDK
jgi:hypothetical protein